VSTNLTEQISIFPGGISRKIQDMFALLRPTMQCTELFPGGPYKFKEISRISRVFKFQ